MVGLIISGHSGLMDLNGKGINKMKRILFFLVVLLSVWSVSYADQTLNGRQPREWDLATSNKPLEGKDYQADTTAFTNTVSTGHQATGNAGYLALVGADSSGKNFTYYLWVDGSSGTGVLRMSSFPNIKTYTSFPYGDWRSSTGFGAGGKVSAQ